MGCGLPAMIRLHSCTLGCDGRCCYSPVMWRSSSSPATVAAEGSIVARAELHSALAPTVPGIHFAPLSVIPSVTLPQWLGIAGCMVVFLLVREIAYRMPA